MLKDTSILIAETRTKIFELPNKLLVEWHSEARAIIDTWSSYHVTKEEYEEALMLEGLEHAREKGALAWIADARTATGAFSKELNEYIQKEVLPQFVAVGIKYFITINSTNPDARINVNRFAAMADSLGLQTIKAGSLESSIDWLKNKSSLFS